MFELFMYVYSCNALSARFSAVYRALHSYFMIIIMSALEMSSIQKLIRRWESKRELFYDDIAHVLQNTKKRTYVV